MDRREGGLSKYIYGACLLRNMRCYVYDVCDVSNLRVYAIIIIIII